jgi:hypothetical protein
MYLLLKSLLLLLFSGKTLAIKFGRSISRSDVQRYVSQVESSTLSSYTGRTSSVYSATYGSTTSSSSSSSYRNVNVSVRKSIFRQSSQESSHVRGEVARILNIQKSLIKHVQITSGKTFAIRFAKSVSRTSVQSYISQVESSTISSYTGTTSSVVSASYSSSSSHSGSSSYRNVNVSVRKSIFKQSSQESSHVRTEIAKLLNIKKSYIEHVQITSGKTLAINFARTVSRTDVQSYISQVESSTLSSYTGRTSSVISATYSSSSSSSSSHNYRNVNVSVKKSIFQQSGRESSHVRTEISKLLNIQKSAIEHLQVISGRSLAITFSRSVSRTNVQNYISQIESSTISSYTGQTSSVQSATYSSSSSHSSSSSYRNVNVSVNKSIFKQTTKESSYVRTEIAKLLNIQKSSIDHVQITSGKSIAIRFGQSVSRTNVQNYLSQVQSSTLSSYTGQTSSVYSATYSSQSSSSSNYSYRNVNVSVRKSIFKQSGKESSHVRTEIANLLNIQKSSIKHVQITSGKTLAIEFSKHVSRTNVQNYISQVESSTLSSYTGGTSSVQSATYSSSSSHSSSSSYRNVKVTVKKSIFKQSSQESSYVRTEISKLLNIKKSAIENVHITSGKTLAIKFGRSVSRTDVQSYISRVESSTLSSYTGRTSSVYSATYSSSSSSSGTSSYRNVKISVKKSIFKQSNKESSYVRTEIAKLLNIKKSLISNVQVTSGTTLAIKFARSVSRHSVQNYVSQVQSSTLSSYTGRTSSVVSAHYSSSTSHYSTSSYRNVNVSVKKGIFKQTSQESSHVRSEIARLLNVQKSYIDHVQITSGKTLAIKFARSVSRTDVQSYISQVESSTLSSYTGGTSSVTSATYSSTSTSSTDSSYRNVDVSVKKSIFEQSSKESSYVRTEVARLLNIQKSYIKNVQIHSGKRISINFARSVSRTDVQNYISQVQSSTFSSYTGQTSSVQSATYSSSSSHSSSSSYRNVNVSVKKSIFKQSSQESSHVRTEIARRLNIDKSSIEHVQVTSGKTLAIQFARSVSRTNVQSYISRVQSFTLSSYTGRTSIVQSATYSSSSSHTGSSYRNVNVSVRKSIFKQSSQESSHVRTEIARRLNIDKSSIEHVQVTSGTN